MDMAGAGGHPRFLAWIGTCAPRAPAAGPRRGRPCGHVPRPSAPSRLSNPAIPPDVTWADLGAHCRHRRTAPPVDRAGAGCLARCLASAGDSACRGASPCRWPTLWLGRQIPPWAPTSPQVAALLRIRQAARSPAGRDLADVVNHRRRPRTATPLDMAGASSLLRPLPGRAHGLAGSAAAGQRVGSTKSHGCRPRGHGRHPLPDPAGFPAALPDANGVRSSSP